MARDREPTGTPPHEIPVLTSDRDRGQAQRADQKAATPSPDGSGRVAANGEREELPARWSCGRSATRRSIRARLFDETRVDHPQRRRPNQRQPQRIRRRVDQAAGRPGDRDQQEGRPRHVDTIRILATPRRAPSARAFRKTPTRWPTASSTPVPKGLRRPTGDRRFERAAMRADATLGQAG